MSALEELAQAILENRVCIETKGFNDYRIVVEPPPGPVEVPND